MSTRGGFGLFGAVASSVFEAFLAKRGIREILCVRQNPQKGLTLTLTKQALRPLFVHLLSEQHPKGAKRLSHDPNVLFSTKLY